MIVTVRLYILTSDESRFPYRNVALVRAAADHVVVDRGPSRFWIHQYIFHLLMCPSCVRLKVHMRHCITITTAQDYMRDRAPAPRVGQGSEAQHSRMRRGSKSRAQRR